ncbi:hypothetical protein TVAG_373350 [Trichomonas vaginalis G3]|uniref:Flagellar associated protein n=1 Tax=Trichomonas vaginalis (strain ATCC PRA-98 / G3) TaxID=412133 RepID=A2DZJ8_TRIV3|nr:cilia- and flagella-associated protein 58-related family [Trichomonas vaginalis G3]EAY14202.1 hypothetical protein TVAG_373350 [Trichomonas vaginalis G3]KAI5539197.1 cilia- and flagella-associated protein 58-related family [Trichomonas vaginalis G3]|eukprot:XP_001326425.1 hypothetical protein [Trichomonas vaginalis G3]
MSDEKDFSEVDNDNLDDLEKDFTKIMDQIALDENLNKFGQQYKQLHEAFLTSHKNNSELIDRCRRLNNEIVQNSTRVNSVLKLSQDDQRTIAGLKFEFDKAWKMVEMSQEREQKSRDVIESLKDEVTKLGKLAEEGGAQSFMEENSLESIQKDINALKSEISLQTTQLNSLQTDNDSWKKKTDEMKKYTSTLSDEVDKINTELTDLREQTKSVEVEVKGLMDDVQNTRDAMLNSQKEIQGFSSKFSDKQKLIEYIKVQKENARRELRDLTELKNDSIARLSVAKKTLELKSSFSSKVQRDINDLKSNIDEKDQDKSSYDPSVKDVDQSNEVSSKELQDLQQYREQVRAEINKMRDRISACRSEIFRLQHDLLRSEGEKNYTKRSISLGQHLGSVAKAEVIQEKKNREAEEGATATVFIDITNTMIQKTNSEEKVEDILHEIERHSASASQYRSETMTVEYQLKDFEETRKSLELQLNGIQSKIQRYETLQNSLVEQRDLNRRQLEVLKIEGKKIEEENVLLQNDIQNSKELIRQKDLQCIEVHKQCEEIKESLPAMERENQQSQAALKEMTLQISTKYNELVRSRYYRDVAISGMKEILIAVNSLSNGKHAHESRINLKHDESEKLREKVKALEWQVSYKSSMYNDAVEKVEELKKTLISEVSRTKKLMEQTQHSKALFKESLQAEKQLLTLRGRVRALEDELETPMNIHRWRFLEGTNPELMQLIKMTQSLRNTLMLKIAASQRVREMLEKQKKMNELEVKKLSHESKEEQEAKINYYNDVLQTKKQQLKIVEQNYNMQTPVVVEGRDSVSAVRQQLRDAKLEYFAQKQQNEQLRASSSMTQKVTTLLPDSKPRFVGGGFVTSSASPQPIVNSPLSPTLKTSLLRVPKKKNQMSTHALAPLTKALQPLAPVVE